MPVDPSSPSYIFVQALLGQTPDPDQVATLRPDSQRLIQAAQQATSEARRATILLVRAGQTDTDRLLAALQEVTWPEPTPFGHPPVPDFPYHHLPPWLRDLVAAEATATQTPSDLAAMLALAVLATVCAGRAHVNPWGDWIEPLNLFILVALPPGHRKSAVFANIVQPLHQYEADAAHEAAPQLARARRARHAAEQALLRAENALALALAASDDSQQDTLLALVQRRTDDLAAIEPVVVRRLITDDCSPERLAMLLHQQGGRLAILSPEGGIFDLIAGRYSTTGAPNLDHILKGHAGDPIVVDRVGRPGEIIPKPALTIGLAVQPEVLRGLANRPGFHGRGLLARFLYAVPSTALGNRAVDPEPVPESLRAQYRHHILTLLQSPLPHPTRASSAPDSDCLRGSQDREQASIGLPLSTAVGRGSGGGVSSLVLPYTPAAADRLRDFARSIEPRLAPGGDLEPIVDWASKLVGATARISGLLHLAAVAPDRPVSPDTVDAAVAIAEYLIAHARAAYDAMGLDPALAQTPALLAWLQRTRPSTFTRRDARYAIRSHIRSDHDLDDALDRLTNHGYIRPHPLPARPGAGRPASPLYDVHPSLAHR